MEYHNSESESARERLQSSREFDAGSGMDYGVGFDALANEIKGDCVIRSTPSTPTGAGGQEIFFSLDQISDYSSLSEAMNISASASLKATFGRGSAKVQFLSEQKINQYSIYLLVRVSVKNAPKRMRDVKLETTAYDLLKRKGPEAFRKRCGDEFIVGISTGGEFFGILEIKTEDQTNKQTIEASIRASGALGAWKVGADFKNAIEKVAKTNQIRAIVLQQGGANTTVPVTVDEMIDRAINFPSNVAGDRAFPISGIFLSYDTLDLPDGKNPIDTQQQQDVLLKLASYRLNYLNLLSNIEYILNHPKEFEIFDPLNLQNKANQIRETINNIAESASTCFNDYTKCRLLSLPPLDTSLPSRKEDIYEAQDLCERMRNGSLPSDVANEIASFLDGAFAISWNEGSGGGLLPIVSGKETDCNGLLDYLRKQTKFAFSNAFPSDSEVPFIGDLNSRDALRVVHRFAPNLEQIAVSLPTNELLEQVQKFKNLKRLALYGQDLEILDFGLLANLTSLNELYLLGTRNFDTLPLLTGLKVLSVASSEAVDTKLLVSSRGLERLSIGSVGDKSRLINLVDLAPLKETLTRLTLNYGEITDLTALASLERLEKLDLRVNKINDISPLSNLKRLTRLDLYSNQVSNLSPLRDLSLLEYLYLGHNKIEDLTPLQNLASLYHLDVSANLIKDWDQVFPFIMKLPVGPFLRGFYYSDNPLPPIEILKTLTNPLSPIEIFKSSND